MNTTLAELTTLGIGGRIQNLHTTHTEAEFIEAIMRADEHHTPLLVLGGGSNVVAGDELFEGVVLRDGRQEISVKDSSTCGGATVRVSAGTVWDEFVAHAIEQEWIGIEALSGIPGSVGATPVQNVGAYGQQVSDTIAQVRTFDRKQRRIQTLFFGDLKFGYRTSILKQSMNAARVVQSEVAGQVLDPRWRYTPRFVVLDVTFQFTLGTRSASIKYAELARQLGVELGQRAPSAHVREQVLAIRAAKGMVVDPADPDTHSAGSFFTNPIVSSHIAATLPAGSPQFEHADGVKLSAAWLISKAGIERGFVLHEADGSESNARISTKHSLALTNAGGATQKQILDLAYAVRDQVYSTFGVELIPEPLIMGAGWQRK